MKTHTFIERSSGCLLDQALIQKKAMRTRRCNVYSSLLSYISETNEIEDIYNSLAFCNDITLSRPFPSWSALEEMTKLRYLYTVESAFEYSPHSELSDKLVVQLKVIFITAFTLD